MEPEHQIIKEASDQTPKGTEPTLYDEDSWSVLYTKLAKINETAFDGNYLQVQS